MSRADSSVLDSKASVMVERCFVREDMNHQYDDSDENRDTQSDRQCNAHAIRTLRSMAMGSAGAAAMAVTAAIHAETPHVFAHYDTQTDVVVYRLLAL